MDTGKIFRESCLATASAAIVLLLAVAAHAGGYLHWESSAFLLNYTADKPFLNIIFAPDRNDWGLYQCRELSYVLDYIDANFVFFLLKQNIVWFVSPVCIVLMIFCIWLQQYAGRRLFPRLPGVFFTLHAIAFALLPAFTQNIFFRSSKFLAAAAIGVLIFGTALSYLKNPGFWGKTSTVVTAAVIAVFADRQGMFFVTAYTGLMAVVQYMKPDKHLKSLLRSGAAVVIAGICANMFLVPAIIHAVNGYFPDFSYQTDFEPDFSVLPEALIFVSGNIGHFFAGCSCLQTAWPIGCMLLFGVWLLLRRSRHIHQILFPGAVVSILVCSGLMIARHQAVMDASVIFSGYFLPSAVIMSFFFFAALEQLPEYGVRRVFLLPAVIIGIRLYPYCNPELLVVDNTYQKVYQDATYRFKQAVENPNCDYRILIMPYRMELLLNKLGR